MDRDIWFLVGMAGQAGIFGLMATNAWPIEAGQALLTAVLQFALSAFLYRLTGIQNKILIGMSIQSLATSIVVFSGGVINAYQQLVIVAIYVMMLFVIHRVRTNVPTV